MPTDPSGSGGASAVNIPANFIEFYDSKNKFTRWVQRFEGALSIYGVTSAKTCNSYFLHYVGADLYETLCDLVSPEKPEDRDYTRNVCTLQKHLDPTPLEIAEYFKFHHRHQLEGESVKDYIATLRKMATTCNFGGFLTTALRNQLVCGLKSQRIKDRLLEVRDLTLEKAMDIAAGMESALAEGAHTKEVQAVQTTIRKKNNFVRPQSQDTAKKIECYRCGGEHYANKCAMINAKCNYCQKVGHIKRMCMKIKKVNAVETEEGNNEEIVHVNNCEMDSSKKFWIKAKISNSEVLMEFDSGSAVSIMNENDYKKICKEKLVPTKVRLCTYSNQFLNVLGVANVTAAIGQETQKVKLYIISGSQHPLLGREWIRQFETFKDFRDGMTHVNHVSPGNVPHAVPLQKLFEKYSALFNGKNVGEIKGEPVALHVKPDAKPSFFRARSVPFALKERVEQEIDNLVNEGVLVKVDYSEWATPIVPVVKPDGKIRICGDYKISVNQNLLVDEHPLPTSEELFNGLAGGEKYTKIDLRNAYLNWKVREEDQQLLTLNTHKGLYKCTRLMFGLNCAPAKWQRKIESILKDIPGVHCFIDDIRVTAPNDTEHLNRLNQVFARLVEYGLKVNLKKSEFMKDQIEYCGYKISKEGIHKVDSKVKAVVEALNPTNVSELQALLGLVNYYGRFLPNLSNTLEPLHELLRKGTVWNWSTECEKALLTIKKQMLSDTVLAHYSPDLPLVLATDASPTGVGAILSHIMPDGTERPIHYASQTLNASQRKWAQIDKEAFAIVFGVKRFFQYLYGRKFILFTDHKPLVQIFSPSKALPHLSAARMQHYAIFLQGFQYEIKYKNSKENANADAFSRLPIAEESASIEEADVFLISMISVLPVTAKDIAAATKDDQTLRPLFTGVLDGKKVAHSDRFGIDQTEFSLLENCLMRGSRVVVPTCLRGTILNDLHSCHFGMNRMLALARSYCWWPGIDKDIKNLAKNCVECALHLNSPPSVAQKHTWEYPSKPFERVHIDFAGKFQNVYFLLIVDAFSKWPETHILNRIDTDSTIEVLDKVFTTFGYPKILTSDNGTQFANPKFDEYLKKNGITHKRSAPYNPATNGQVERYVQTFKNKLRCLQTNKNNLQRKINEILFQYRITPHPATGKPPAEMVFTYRPNSRFSLLCPNKSSEMNCPDESTVLPQKEVRVVRVRKLLTGERVVARNYLGEGNWKLGNVEKVLGELHYLIRLDNGMLWRRHIDQLRRVGDNTPATNDRSCYDHDTDTLQSPHLDSAPIRSTTPPPSSLVMPLDDTGETLQPDDVNVPSTPSVSLPSITPESTTPVVPRRSKRIMKPVSRLNL